MRAAVVDRRLAPIINLATSPVANYYTLPVASGAGYMHNYYATDSTPTIIAPGADGPVVDGVALGYVRSTIKTASVPGSRTVWMFTYANPDVTSLTPTGVALPVRTGHRYRVSYWQRITIAGSPAADQAGITAAVYDSNGARLVQMGANNGGAIVYGSWQRVSVPLGDMPGGASVLALRQRSILPTVTIGDTSDVTGLIITDITTRPGQDQTYRTGDSPGWRWLGTTNASPSVGYPTSP